MSSEELTKEVISIIREVCETDVPLESQTSLYDVFEVDSLMMTRVDLALQSRVGLAIDADDLLDIVTVEDLVKALLAHGQPVSREALEGE
jgi:acyl carrier protein